MIDRNYIEKVLQVNGLSATAPDEQIRSVLVSAKWEEEDVQTALTVLRENDQTGETRVDTVHNVFTSDMRLSPEAINSLLGIEVDMTTEELLLRERQKNQVSFWQVMSIVLYATLLAFGSIVVVMYVQQFGPFHPGF